MTQSDMTPARPYLLRAMHAWITDNDLTPYILVNSERDGVDVPQDYAVDGKIVLNVSTTAIRELQIDNDAVCFDARFGGRSRQIRVPIAAIEAIYAKENGQGMVFNDDEQNAETPPENDPDKPSRGKPKLTIVK